MIRSWHARVASAILWTSLVSAAPKIEGGAVNAASKITPGLPDYGVARGALFSLKGEGLGPEETIRGEFPLGEELGGTVVTVQVGDEKANAVLVSASAKRVVAILPSSLPAGSGVVTLTYNGEEAVAPIEVVEKAFGIFTTPNGNILAFNEGQGLNDLAHSARPGQQVTLIGTGLGPVGEDERNPIAVQDVPAELTVTVGGHAAEIVSAGKVGLNEGANGDLLELPRGLSAIDQITFVVPEGVNGCTVSVSVQNGGMVSNWPTLSVAPEGGACNDLGNLGDLTRFYTGEPLKVASINLTRVGMKMDVPYLGSMSIHTDVSSGSFRKNTVGGIPARALDFSPVSMGQCIAMVGKPEDSQQTPEADVAGEALDAGEELRLQGPKGVRTLKKQPFGIYTDISALDNLPTLPGMDSDADTTPAIPNFPNLPNLPNIPSIPNIPTIPNIPELPNIPSLPELPTIPSLTGDSFLEPGEYTVDNGGGGADVGSFVVTSQVKPAPEWTNNDEIQSVDRSADLTVRWTGGSEGSHVMIYGFSAAHQATASFYCVADASAGELTIPAYVLSRLPATAGGDDLSSLGGLFLASVHADLVDIPGIDLSVFSTSAVTGKTLSYK